MAMEALDKPQQPKEPLATWRSLYHKNWDLAFREFMFLMSEQYSLELTVKVNDKTAESPIVKFWRESLQSLTPNQMREGLKRYMDSDRRSFKPAPGDIKDNAPDATDRPRKRKDPNCPDCHGNGWRLVIADSKHFPGKKREMITDCFCVRIEYDGQSYIPAPQQLPAAPELPPEQALAEVAKAANVISPVKHFPEATREMSDREYQDRTRQLEEQRQRLLAKSPTAP